MKTMCSLCFQTLVWKTRMGVLIRGKILESGYGSFLKKQANSTMRPKGNTIHYHGCKNNKEKLNRLYSYLQQNMRYVSIQLGIGGWKPMNVQQVHDFKYGDCKALSNYMKHVLNVAGIPSKYVIINAGVAENLDDTTLVRNSFNHAILAAFPDNDTVFWNVLLQKLQLVTWVHLQVTDMHL